MWSSKNSGKTVNIDGKSGNGNDSSGELCGSGNYICGPNYTDKGNGNCVKINNSYFSNGTQGGGYSTNGGSGGINTHGGSYAYGYDYAPGKHAYNISFKSIMDRTSSPAHGYLVPDKTINLRNNNLTDSEIAVLAGNLQYQRLDLDVFDVSNNKIGFGGVENLFYGLRFDNTLAGRYIVTMNFSNNLIGDDGAKYMADSLAMGRFPHLKSLNVSDNQITATGEGYFVNNLSSLKTQDIAIILKKITVTGNEAIKSAIDFTLKGLKYVVNQHAKNQGLIEADTIAIYGGKHCEQALSTGVKVISMGLIKECGKHPEIVKVLQQGVWQAKVVAGLGLFALTVGNNLDALATPEMIHCIAGWNENKFGDVPIDEYTKPLSGDSYDY